MTEVRHIKFAGIDDFSRPVYKVLEEENYYIGSVLKLFDYQATEKEVNDFFRNNLDQLEYFGNEFNCEPCGGQLGSNIKLILEE